MAWGFPLFFLQLDLDTSSTVFLVFFSGIMSIVGGVWLTRHFAQSLVRVFKIEDAVAAGIVRQALLASYIPFRRRESEENVSFDIRGTDLTLVVKNYPLNLPIDDQLETVTASKIEILGLDTKNKPMAEKLCLAINKSVAQRTKLA